MTLSALIYLLCRLCMWFIAWLAVDFFIVLPLWHWAVTRNPRFRA